jgi:hypothetical protein
MHAIFMGCIRPRFRNGEIDMESEQAQTHRPEQTPKTRPSAKNTHQALPPKKPDLASELSALMAISKRTFAADDRIAVRTLLEVIYNQVSRWEAESRLEEGLYGLLDTLQAPVPLRVGEAFSVVIYCTAPHVDKKSRSKWARALRYATAVKPADESIKKFIKRRGGINACASAYAQLR